MRNEVIHNLYALPNIIRVIKPRRGEMGGACSTHGRNGYKILVGKPNGNGPLGRPKRIWENNIRNDLRETAGRCRMNAPGDSVF